MATQSLNIGQALAVLTEAGMKPTMLPYRNYRMGGRFFTCTQIKAEAMKVLKSQTAATTSH